MLSVGQIFGHYEIVERLGEGGMGIVYKARDTRLGRLVAIKILRPERLTGSNPLSRFQFEARATSNLNHPNIVVVHDIASEADVHYLVMEYIGGKTLKQAIPPEGMALSEALEVALQIAEGVGAAAEAGIIHRDLKPSNIMITESGQVKILDFGMAKALGMAKAFAVGGADGATVALQSQPRTEEGSIFGTVEYMSPEQAEGKTLDSRSDIFSFGAVLYEMVTGRSAFNGGTVASTISAILRDSPTPISDIVGSVPDELEVVISRCLRKEPARRFQTIADVRVCLLELMDEGARQTGRRIFHRRRTSRRFRRAAIYFGAASFAAVLLLAIGRRYLYRTPAEPPPVIRVTPFANYQGYLDNPAFSRDGSQIAFEWNGGAGATTHIYVKVIGTDFSLPVTSGPFQDTHPVFAPDNRSIAFLRLLPKGRTGIFEVSPLGGPTRLVADIPSALYQQLVWSNDGKWLLTSGHREQQEGSNILAVSVSDGQYHSLSVNNAAYEFCPTLSPDAHELAFVRIKGYSDWEIFVVPVDSNMQRVGTPIRVNTPEGLNRQPVWTIDGKDLVFVNGMTASTRLWRATVANKTPPQQLGFIEDSVDGPAISTRGQRLAFTRTFNITNIWKIGVAPSGHAGQSMQIAESARTSFVRPHAFSADGTRIVFESNRSGQNGIWKANADGSGASLLYGKEGTHAGSPAWSRDSQWVAFDSRNGAHSQIFLISSEGGSPRAVTSGAFDNLLPAWSHDGKWIYFDSNRTRTLEIFKCTPDGSQLQQVTHGGGWGAQESPDGKILYYTRGNGIKTPLLMQPVGGGPETVVLPSVRERWWAPTERGVWYLEGNADEQEPGLWAMNTALSTRGTLRFINLTTHRTGPANLIPRTPMGGLALSPDGRTILLSEVDHQSREIGLAEGFR